MVPRLGIPQPHRLIPTPAGKHLAIRAERHACDRLRMLGECPLQFPRLGIPQPHRLVPTPTGKHLAIRAEREAIDPLRMLGECPLQFPPLDIPQPHRVPTPTGKRRAIRAKRHTRNRICMPDGKGNLLIGRRIIEPNTNGTDNSKLSPVRRIQNSPYTAFAETRNGTFGQIYLYVLLTRIPLATGG